MAHIESSMLVPQSREDVFSFLSKRESHLNFIPRMTTLNQTSQGSFGQIGTTLSGLLNYFGIRIPVEYQIIEVEPDRRLTMKGQMGPVLFEDGYVLESKGSGTAIKFWLDLHPRGWAKVFSPTMGLVGRVHAWETLRNLRRELAKEEVPASAVHSSSP